MTTTDPVESTGVDAWRGKAVPDSGPARDDTAPAGGLRMHAAGRALLVDLIRPYRRRIAAAFAVAIVQVAATMAAPWLIGVAIDTALPAAVRGDYAPVSWVGVGMFTAAVASGWLRSVFVIRSGAIGQAIMFDLRARGFDHVQSLSVSFHERFTSGRVISRLTSDVDTLTDLLDIGLDGLVTAVLNSAVIAVLLLALDVPLALITFASLLPMWLLYRWFSPRAATAFGTTRERVATMIVNIVETFNGIRVVQAFRREKRNDAIFAGLNDAYRDANRVTFNLQAWFMPGITLIGSVTTVIVLLVGGYRVSSGGLELGVLTAFLLYVRQFYDPMEDLGMFYNALQSATAAMDKIARLLGESPEVPEPAASIDLATPTRGAVELREVGFGYQRDRPVLSDLELTIPAGQTVALVGATGAGKTTIAKLISRFYDPTAGSVRLDGVDLREIADDELRRTVVMITQDGFLFSGSVADNIGFGRLEATRAEIVDAARAVGAHEFICSLPDGYDTDVRKRGGRLSAGQRQLVAFARAFLADPTVLILDEATSSLDVPTERAVQRALRTVLAERTALIIAHRLSTVEIADRVLVLESGAIVEDGTPESLIATGAGQFASLHTAWRDSLV